MHDQLPKKQTDTLHADIKDMYELEPADRYSFVRTIMESDGLYDLPTITQDEGITCHYIRDTKTAEGQGATEAPLSDVFQAGDHLFTRLKQCEILEIDTTEHHPYLRANLSECSILIARDEQRLWAAHLGLSQESQLVHALEQLHQAGFSETNCTVIASTGEVQKASNTAGYSPRLASKQEYIDHGFSPDAITTFEYTPPSTPDDRLYRNLCEVTIGPDGQLVTTFDADREMHHGFMREKIHPETVKETFIPLES